MLEFPSVRRTGELTFMAMACSCVGWLFLCNTEWSCVRIGRLLCGKRGATSAPRGWGELERWFVSFPFPSPGSELMLLLLPGPEPDS